MLFAVRHKHPWNFLALALFTACTSYSLGVYVLAFSPAAVFAALALTTSTMGAMALLAFALRDRDLSFFGLGLFGVGWCFLISLFVMSFFSVGPTAHIVTGGLGAALFSAYVVFDVWLMASPYRGLDPDEYILAAANLYLDFVNLLMFFLEAIGGVQQRS